MRTKLFFSYSRADVQWRSLFLRHMKTMVSVEDGLWVDRESIPEGSNWRAILEGVLPDSKCALVLLTPQYLERGSFANDHELPMLLDEQERGLKLLPVLVQPCSWMEQHPALADVQFVKWRNSTKIAADGEGGREVLRALSEAGDEAITNAARESTIDRAVMDACGHIRRAFGVVGQITGEQRAALFDETNSAIETALHESTAALGGGRFALEKEPLHAGDFALVYRGTFDGQSVAVKALPTAVWRNRVRKAFEHARNTSRHLRDAAFIRVEHSIPHPEVHAIVMEYIDWPTLDDRQARFPGRCLPPRSVARILSQISRAQHDAHQVQMQVGALSPSSIYVNDDCEVRIAPIRIEAHLARGVGLSTGQLMNWDVLTMLTPEIYGGCQPVSPEELDLHEQYYLALLGLELLLGRRPVEVSCFQDLNLKARFFDDPRAFFDGDGPANRWTDDCPALAFILARMLSRTPTDRLESASVASEELTRIFEDRLPNVLRRSLEADLGVVGCEGFAARFYQRLFEVRPTLRSMFRDPTQQAQKLAHTVRDLVGFRREDGVAARFRDQVDRHAGMGIVPEDMEAFRKAFVAEVVETATRDSGAGAGRIRGDAWNAALKMGIEAMQQGASANTAPSTAHT